VSEMLECCDEFDRVRAESFNIHPVCNRQKRLDEPRIVRAIGDFSQNKVF
jgi:hypothetical protein